jgi:hypothetical protein
MGILEHSLGGFSYIVLTLSQLVLVGWSPLRTQLGDRVSTQKRVWYARLGMGWAGGFSNQALPFIKDVVLVGVYVCFWEARLLDGLRACMHAGGFERWNFFSSPLVALTLLLLLLPFVEGALSSDGDLSRAGLGG